MLKDHPSQGLVGGEHVDSSVLWPFEAPSELNIIGQFNIDPSDSPISIATTSPLPQSSHTSNTSNSSTIAIDHKTIPTATKTPRRHRASERRKLFKMPRHTLYQASHSDPRPPTKETYHSSFSNGACTGACTTPSATPAARQRQ